VLLDRSPSCRTLHPCLQVGTVISMSWVDGQEGPLSVTCFQLMLVCWCRLFNEASLQAQGFCWLEPQQEVCMLAADERMLLQWCIPLRCCDPLPVSRCLQDPVLCATHVFHSGQVCSSVCPYLVYQRCVQQQQYHMVYHTCNQSKRFLSSCVQGMPAASQHTVHISYRQPVQLQQQSLLPHRMLHRPPVLGTMWCCCVCCLSMLSCCLQTPMQLWLGTVQVCAACVCSSMTQVWG